MNVEIVENHMQLAPRMRGDDAVHEIQEVHAAPSSIVAGAASASHCAATAAKLVREHGPGVCRKSG